jgi:uncharacterized protein YndB with AHSA1/START domain
MPLAVADWIMNIKLNVNRAAIVSWRKTLTYFQERKTIMKKTIFTTLTLIALCCLITGCGHVHSPDGDSASGSHAHVHTWKYNEVVVEFPGHTYALEIIDEKETTGLVTAFLTDTHCEPIEVDTTEVRLNFRVGGSPKTFTLTRIEQETGEPATFTLTDMELATLLCEGWQGDATASVSVSGAPYNAKLVKLAEHDHDH